MAQDGLAPDVVDEARRVLAAAASREVPLRLLGGIAILLRSHGLPPALQRTYNDIDLATVKGRGRVVGELLVELGYEAEREFNALHGARRMLFQDRAHGRHLDVFVDRFEMCHAIPLGDRLLVEPDTIPLAELLLTKLQIFELNEKDLRDTVALLASHDVAEHDGDAVNAAYIASLTASDWGLWRTARMNLERVREGVAGYDVGAGLQAAVVARVDALWERIEAEPKSRGWRLRDRVGDRKRWYEVPDEVG